MLLNIQVIRECLLAAEKENLGNKDLEGVFIEDDENKRHYVATNKYIMVHASEQRKPGDMVLKNPLLLKPVAKLQKKLKGHLFFAKTEQEDFLQDKERFYFLKIINEKYIEWRKILPESKNLKRLKFYPFIDWKWTKILQDIGEGYLTKPWSEGDEDWIQPVVFKFKKGSVNYEIIIQPRYLSL